MVRANRRGREYLLMCNIVRKFIETHNIKNMCDFDSAIKKDSSIKIYIDSEPREFFEGKVLSANMLLCGGLEDMVNELNER